MPYPLLKLPYGLQRRLRNLATKIELYNLQVAIGTEISYLQPLQMCTIISSDACNLYRSIGQFTITADPSQAISLPIDGTEQENFVIVKGKLRIANNVDTLASFTHALENILIRCESIAIMNCTMTADNFEKLKMHSDCAAVTKFAVHKNCDELSLRSVLDTFKNVETFIWSLFGHPCYNWVHDLMNFGKTNLTSLILKGRFSELFRFEASEMTQILQRQKCNFVLSLICHNPPMNAESQVRHTLGSHFDEWDQALVDTVAVLNVRLWWYGNNFTNPYGYAFQLMPKQESSNWVEDIVQSGKRGLESITFSSSFENLFNFEPRMLLSLFQTQTLKLEVKLLCDNPPEDAEARVRSMLGTVGEEINYPRGYLDGIVYTRLGQKHMYFQVGPKTDRVSSDVNAY